MNQGTLTVIARIQREHARELDALRANLRKIDQDPGFFTLLPHLHFARWAILDHAPEAAPRDGPGDVFLVFGADFESDHRRPGEVLAGFVGELVDMLVERKARTGDTTFDDVHRRCEGYPSGGLDEPEAVKGWLIENSKGYGARHIAFAYRASTVESLKQSLSLRDEVDRRLDELPPGQPVRSAGEIYRELRWEAWGRHPRLFDAQAKRRRELARRAALLATIWYAPIDQVLFVLNAVVERAKAIAELARRALARLLPSRRPRPAPVGGGRLRELAAGRQHAVQNPLVVVNDIRGGWLGQARLRLLLPILNLRFKRYLEGLNHIATIHFARWVVFRAGRGRYRLLFFSNFDGTWDSYIDSFLDNPDVRLFLDKIWGLTAGFPGIDDPQAFKAWLLASECQADVWYSAYRGCGEQSAVDLHNAFRLTLIFEEEYGSPEVQAFLATGLGASELTPMSFWKAIHGLAKRPAPGPIPHHDEREERTHHVAAGEISAFRVKAREAASALRAP